MNTQKYVPHISDSHGYLVTTRLISLFISNQSISVFYQYTFLQAQFYIPNTVTRLHLHHGVKRFFLVQNFDHVGQKHCFDDRLFHNLGIIPAESDFEEAAHQLEGCRAFGNRNHLLVSAR